MSDGTVALSPGAPAYDRAVQEPDRRPRAAAPTPAPIYPRAGNPVGLRDLSEGA